MYSIIIKRENVSIRPFLFLLDSRNKGKEFSNTTVCDYIIDNYPDLMKGYKDPKSFRSGYAGNFSLLFDSDESQEGRLNKNTKLVPKILKETFKKLVNVNINFDDTGFFHITNIPDQKSFQILAVFFCLKPINATINSIVDLKNPEKTWIPIIAKKLSCSVDDFPSNKNQITGRGDSGRTSTLNRYTIYNRGNNWFDVIKPNYYNFESLRYKIDPKKQIRRFEHIEFQVKAEYNVASFCDHEESKEKVLQSKYILCENSNSKTYKTKFDLEIPVITIKDFE